MDWGEVDNWTKIIKMFNDTADKFKLYDLEKVKVALQMLEEHLQR